MRVLVLGAGVIGTSSAYYLASALGGGVCLELPAAVAQHIIIRSRRIERLFPSPRGKA
jgi:glycine/D-amino acid oxidase-like deaminating enzyme